MEGAEYTVTAADVDWWKSVVRVDWVVSRAWNRLHHIDPDSLTETQWREFAFDTILPGPVRLSCGRTAASITVPGVFTRMGADRCAGCCRATGMPLGVGSPKNDHGCRKVLGSGGAA